MPKRKLKTKEDEVHVDGWPISCLHVFQIRSELRKCGLSSIGKKQELVERLSLHCKRPDPFKSLPDELVLTIVKMASAFTPRERDIPKFRRGAYNHTFIIGSLSKVSRFNRIARDRSLWGDWVAINWIDHNPKNMVKFQELVDNAVKSFIGDRMGMETPIRGYPPNRL